MDILIFLVIGILLGLFVIPKKVAKANSILQQISMVAALFLMGLSLGMTPTLWEDLKTAGIVSICIAAATVLGSVLAVWLLTSLFMGRKRK